MHFAGRRRERRGSGKETREQERRKGVRREEEIADMSGLRKYFNKRDGLA